MSKEKEIIDIKAIKHLLSSLITNPSNLENTKICLDDFINKEYQILFSVCNNLYQNGVENITEITILNYLQKYPLQLALFNKANGQELLKEIVELKENNYKYYYNKVKKISMLRKLDELGLNVSQLFCKSAEIDLKEKEMVENNFENATLKQIQEFFRAQLEECFGTIEHQDIETIQAGDNIDETIDKCLAGEIWGIPFASEYLTTATYGKNKKMLYIYSTPSGKGKSRNALKDFAFSAAKELYNPIIKKWEANELYDSYNGGIYIQYEMDNYMEVQPILLAYIANVSTSKIKEGRLSVEELQRIRYAGQVIKNSKMWLASVKEFTIEKIKAVVSEYKRKYNIDEVYFDYISENPHLIAEYADKISARIGIRVDMVLTNLSTALKEEVCIAYDVAVVTSTQITGNWRDIRTEQLIQGAKAIINKADYWWLLLPITPADKEKIQPLLSKSNYIQEPTHLLAMQKGRGSRYDSSLLWLNIDYGTMRSHDCFATNSEYEYIKMPKTVIKNKKEK